MTFDLPVVVLGNKCDLKEFREVNWFGSMVIF